jgi:hypothetical protein
MENLSKPKGAKRTPLFMAKGCYGSFLRKVDWSFFHFPVSYSVPVLDRHGATPALRVRENHDL